jgi:hypothetical protein
VNDFVKQIQSLKSIFPELIQFSADLYINNTVFFVFVHLHNHYFTKTRFLMSTRESFGKIQENPWEKESLPNLPNTQTNQTENDTEEQDLRRKALSLQQSLFRKIKITIEFLLKTEKSKVGYMNLFHENQTLVEYMNNLVKATENK